MKLLLITTSYPDVSEGSAAAGLFVQDFANTLVQQGVDVEVIAPGTKNRCDLDGHLRITRFAVPWLPLSLLNPLNARDWIAIVRTLSAGQNAVIRSCSENRPDHVFALWALPSGGWARRVMRKFSIQYSVWALGSDIWGLGQIPLIRSRLAQVLRDASHCFADGIRLATDVQHISGRECKFLPSSRVFGPPGIRDLNPAPPYRLAFLGRWHTNKGPDVLLDSLTLLSEIDWAKIKAIRICGGGSLETLLSEKVDALTKAGRPVELHGYQDLAAARELFEWSDYVLIPSRVESVPIVFSDAMQMHRPVIATPVGDLPDLINKYNCGIAADQVSSSGLAQAISHALSISPRQYDQGLFTAAAAFQVENTVAIFLKTISA